jgi:T5SS/PEP-CTERM-associated repeat protein
MAHLPIGPRQPNGRGTVMRREPVGRPGVGRTPMTISNTYRWTGKLGSDWNALNPPSSSNLPPVESNWDLLDGTASTPSFPTGTGDVAVFDLGGAISVTAKTEEGASGIGGAEEIQVVNASEVTFSDDFFFAGQDGSGGLIIDEAATLTLAEGASMVDTGGSLDVVGLTSGSTGTLVVGRGTGFDDTNMIIGVDEGATGVVSVDGASLFGVAQSGLGTADGVLKVGDAGDGSMNVSNTSNFGSATAILGVQSGATGTVAIENSTWGGSTLTVGGAGTGASTIAAGSTLAFFSLTVGESNNGSIEVTGASSFTADFAILGQNTAATGDVTIDDSTWLDADLTIGQAGMGTATVEAGAAMTVGLALTVGASGQGSIDLSGSSQLLTQTAILGEQDGATGDVTLDDSIWSGGTVTVGASGSGNVEIDTGSTLSFTLATVGLSSDGSIDVSGGSLLNTDTANLGTESDAVGNVTIDDSNWTGGAVTVGEAGTANAAIEAGSTAAFTSISIGTNGELDVSGATGALSQVTTPDLTLNFGTLDVSGNAEVLMGPTAGAPGVISIQGGFALDGLGTVNGDVTLIDGGMVQADLPIPGGLTINGNITGDGTIEPLMTLEVNGQIDAGVTIAFGPSLGAEVGDLTLDVPGGAQGTIVGFGIGNVIDIEGSLYSDAVFTQGPTGSAGTLILSGSGFAPLALAVEGDYVSNSFTATPGASDTIVMLAPCYASGTRIATEFGEVMVDDLRVGDRVLCLMQGTAPIVWTGRRHVDLRHHPEPRKVWPVRVSAGAFGPGRPHTDLFLSPDHAVYVNEVLIPIRYLINRTTIAQVPVDRVTYHHIELPRHDVIHAEGLPAESFLDIKDGSNYANRPGPVRRYPDFAARVWEAFGCARLVVTGPELVAARALVAQFATYRTAA